MKKQLNEQFKRMQLLAGLITESQLEEAADVTPEANKIKAYLDNQRMRGEMGNGLFLDKVLDQEVDYIISLEKLAWGIGAYVYLKNDEKGQKLAKEIQKSYGGDYSQSFNQGKVVGVTNIGYKKQEPTAESIDIEKSVNEALRKYRKLITKSQLNEAVKSIDSNTIQRTGDTPITKEDLVIGTTRVAPSMSYGSKEELALNAGTVTKVDGDKATYDVKGKIHSMDLADLLIVITT